MFNIIRNKNFKKIVDTKSHKEAVELCIRYGGQLLYGEPDSGECTFKFTDNLFVKDCKLCWFQYPKFTGVKEFSTDRIRL